MPCHKVLRTQSRKMVHNVYKFMEKQAEEGPQIYRNETLLQTSKATGIPVKIVRKILKGDSDHTFSEDQHQLDSKVKRRVNKINSFDRYNIKNCIYNFYKTENVLPSVKQVFFKLKEENKFKGSMKRLRSILRELGFKKNQTEKNHSVLIEGTNIRLGRIEYLRAISRFRREGRAIIYTGESYIDYSSNSFITFSDNGLYKHRSKVQRVIIAHAASNTGFIPSTLLMYKDYSTRMNYDNYQKWICNQVIPNVPKNSVIVLSNAPYYNNLEESVLTAYSKRSDMESWLTEKCIVFSPQMLKPQLFKLISSHKDYFKKYKIDCIIEANNHTVLRLPSNNPELNPLKIVFEDINDNVAQVTDILNVNMVKKIVNENCRSMKVQEWNIIFEKVKKIEEEYKNIDIIIDTITDETNLHYNDEYDADMNVDDDTDSSSDENTTEENAFCCNEVSIDIKYVPDALDPLSN